MRQGPLAGRYPAVAAMVTLALIPYLALSAALDPLVPIISEQLHMSAQTISLSSGLGNASYAVGTVLAVQFAQHLPQRVGVDLALVQVGNQIPDECQRAAVELEETLRVGEELLDRSDSGRFGKHFDRGTQLRSS